MENMREWEQRNLINELTEGRELAKQVQLHLSVPSSPCHDQTRELILLVQKIQASYEKALSILNFNTSLLAADHQQPPQAQPQPSGVAMIRMPESPPSRSGSPRSEDSDRDFKEQQEFKDASKKRKTLPRWTQLVRVTPGTALEGPLDDGFSWRKYGQKDILGAKYPRGYYRCTHRNVQGCLATKQVQRSDEDPTIFEITYRGRHTCNLGLPTSHSHSHSHALPLPLPPPPASAPPENQDQPTTNCMEPNQNQNQNQQPEPNQINQSQDLLLNFQRGLKVITENLDNNTSFPYHNNNNPSSSTTPISNVKGEETSNVFSPCVVGNLSATTNNYFAVSPTPTGMMMNINLGTSEIIQAVTSATNSPTVALDHFPFGNTEFDPNFTFDNHGFLS
ncbi:DNA-binding WRKY [Corchorus capsularis]|uniref:DNA-binding WRKY n=1 Tax=Corchorus capsularis TaxID=210143 RepID=A0A1R3I057_COCAP|nr:DNA-binding WRKY [Corchorus capsularis]